MKKVPGSPIDGAFAMSFSVYLKRHLLKFLAEKIDLILEKITLNALQRVQACYCSLSLILFPFEKNKNFRVGFFPIA